MSDIVVSRPGQVNLAGDPLSIFLKVYAGRTLLAFLRKTVMKDRFQEQAITKAKVAQFPATGILTTQAHNPGDAIVGQQLAAAEKDIYIEGKRIADIFIADIDKLMTQYDYSGAVSEQLAQALAKRWDGDVGRSAIMGARQTTPNVKGVFPGDILNSTEVNSLFATDGPTLVNAIFDAAVAFDVRDIPAEDRTAFFKPLQYSLIVKDGRATNIFQNESRTNLGGFAMNTVKEVAGIPITKTNNYPTTNDVGNADQPTTRQHDFSTSAGIVTHKTAVGTVKLTDMAMESWYDPRRQGNFMIGKYICGHDWLRPESAFEFQSAVPAG